MRYNVKLNSIVIAIAPTVILFLLYFIRKAIVFQGRTMFFSPYSYDAVMNGLLILIGVTLGVFATSIIMSKQVMNVWLIAVNLMILIIYYASNMINFSRQEYHVIPLLAGFYLYMLIVSVIYVKRQSNSKR